MKFKLNLGCGHKRMPGHINVDKYGTPDVLCDLEIFPWPWPPDSVCEIMLNHALEHLGAAPDVFIGIMKEMYRVCEHDARIFVNVPHPRHDHFIGDPTHVRPVTPEMLRLFSKQLNLEWQELGAANSPLALYHDVDFELVEFEYVVDADFRKDFEGKLKQEDFETALRRYNNVASEIRIVMRVVKEAGTR